MMIIKKYPEAYLLLILVAFVCSSSFVQGQTNNYGEGVEIVNDTIYYNEKKVGMSKTDQNQIALIFISKKYKSLLAGDLKEKVAERNEGFKISLRVDEYVLFPPVIFNNKKIYINDILVGRVEIRSKSGSTYVVGILAVEYDDFRVNYIHKEMDKFYERDLKDLYIITAMDYDKQYGIVNGVYVHNKDIEAKRVEHFYERVYLRLASPLEPIEGVFKSLDSGEGVEYDIVILKDSEYSFIGWALTSTDPDVTPGHSVFTFTKSAVPNKFIVEYKLKSGQKFENKLAILEGGVLKMEVKSFMKMYPNEVDNRRYEKINPLVDWNSSGSGVIINKDGLIATNHHVIKGAKSIRVKVVLDSNNFVEWTATLIAENEKNDIALLKITDTNFISFKMNNLGICTNIKPGLDVVTLGYPIPDKMGDNVKVVNGIISSIYGKDGNESYFQTTLPVWYGNSGGPCVSNEGCLLGLVTQITFDKGQKVENVSYISKSENILNLLKETKYFDESQENPILNEELELTKVIELLNPYSVFIKVNY